MIKRCENIDDRKRKEPRRLEREGNRREDTTKGVNEFREVPRMK